MPTATNEEKENLSDNMQKKSPQTKRVSPGTKKFRDSNKSGSQVSTDDQHIRPPKGLESEGSMHSMTEIKFQTFAP